MTSSPAQTRVSLLARPMRFFRRMASSVGFRPSIPTTAVMTQSASSMEAAWRVPFAPFHIHRQSEICSASAVAASSRGHDSQFRPEFPALLRHALTLFPAVRAATPMPRCFTMSRLCRPMEPVEPRILTQFTIFISPRPPASSRSSSDSDHYHHGVEPVQRRRDRE